MALFDEPMSESGHFGNQEVTDTLLSSQMMNMTYHMLPYIPIGEPSYVLHQSTGGTPAILLTRDNSLSSQCLPIPSQTDSAFFNPQKFGMFNLDDGNTETSDPTFNQSQSSVGSQPSSPGPTDVFNPLAASSPQKTGINVTKEPQYQCEKGCTKSFNSVKDLLRHYKSQIHIPPATRRFRCRCGYTNARKDHYRRHLKQGTCKFQHPHFHCVCSQTVFDDDSSKHLEHISICKEGHRPPGRPRKRARMASQC